MIKNVLVCCCLVSLALGCGSDRGLITDEKNSLHLVPFMCSYFGLSIPELSECSIACPSSVYEAHDIEEFTASLECTHPKYSLLQCRIDF